MEKRGCFKIVALCAVLIVQFSGCSTFTPQGRAQRNPQMLESLPDSQRSLVLQGGIAEGMRGDAVFLAWGKPDSISHGSSGGQHIETWRYTTLRAVYRPELAFGLGYFGGYGRHGGRWYPSMGTFMPDYVPVPSAIVRFKNDRVVSWEAIGP